MRPASLRPRRVAAVVLVGLIWIGVPLGLPKAGAEVPEPDGYRQEPYQAPTPRTVLGTAALATDEVKRLWTDRQAVFVDVLPHPPKPANLPQGTIWNEKPHRSIPGAVWLPDVGRGALSAATDDYFKHSLDRLSAGDHARQFVVFCKRDCWMSWNAAKRASSYGYGHVAWYADGVEGWMDADLPLAVVEPSP